MESILIDFDLRSIVPLAASVVLGALIGIEREIHRKPAGLRTNILICLGAATFMMIASRVLANPDAISRMTAGIITGAPTEVKVALPPPSTGKRSFCPCR